MPRKKKTVEEPPASPQPPLSEEERRALFKSKEPLRAELWRMLSEGQRRVEKLIEEEMSKASAFADEHGLAFAHPSYAKDDVGQEYISQGALELNLSDCGGEIDAEHPGWRWMSSWC
jgi:hypothetical protein